MKTLSTLIFAAAVAAVGLGGFVQIRALNERIARLELALAERPEAPAQSAAPAAESKAPAEVEENRPAVTTSPPPAEPRTRPAPQESESGATSVSYLDQILNDSEQ